MGRPALWPAAFVLLLGLAAIWEARKLPLGSVARPGPGFFPYYLAIALALVGAALVVQALRQPAPRPAGAAGSRQRWKAAACLGALVIYALSLESLGFLPGTFLLLIFLFTIIEPQGWVIAIGGSAVTAVLVYLVFKVWLGVQLPIGLWGF
jgi:hypothetical protein